MTEALKGADTFLEYIGMVDSKDSNGTTTLGSGTKIRVGLVVAMFGSLLGIIVAVTAVSYKAGSWASAMSTKMDNVLKNQVDVKSEFERLGADVKDTKQDIVITRQDIKIMDVQGTTRLQETTLLITSLSSRVAELEKALLRLGANLPPTENHVNR